jgi:ADP-dependent NAD(P)H-hydrate dehydratase / NAD(P)H-hydrate epimerase
MMVQRLQGGKSRGGCLFFVRFDQFGGNLETFRAESRVELLTAAQMRAVEAAAIARAEVTGQELMECAGEAVGAAILDTWPHYAAAAPEGTYSAAVLCGPGNNGGDGFVVARLLQARGWTVRVFFWGDASKLPPDARLNYDRWLESGAVLPLAVQVPTQVPARVSGQVSGQATARAAEAATPGAAGQLGQLGHMRQLGQTGQTGQTGQGELAAQLGRPDILIDALFGTGLSRPLNMPLRQLFATVQALRETVGSKVVAVDIASGLCADSGRVLGVAATPGGAPEAAAPGAGSPAASDATPAALSADLTVSFHRAKCGHYLAAGPAHCGSLVVKDIGLRSETPALSETAALPEAPTASETPTASEAPTASETLHLVGPPARHRLAKQQGDHKFSHGHALVLTGGAGKTGAARLAARGALRIGAGLVTLGVPPAAQMEVAQQITALMLTRVADAAALDQTLQDKRINALCIGPGLGLEVRHGDLLALVLRARRAALLDADALTLLARDADLFALLHPKVVLTPHAGEFARLFPDIAGKLNQSAAKGPAFSKPDATRQAAIRAGCVVLFKGADTVIAAPDGRCFLHAARYERAAPWLATAGAGDVLAGFVTGLLARGFAPLRAAEMAAWLHVECARVFGPALIAEDLAEQLPRVLAALK